MTIEVVYGPPVPHLPFNAQQAIVFDLGGVLIDLDIPRCTQAFKELMGEENLKKALGMNAEGKGAEAVSVATRQLMYDYERGNITTEQFFCELQCYSRQGTTINQLQNAWLGMLGEVPAWRIAYLKHLKRQGYRLFMLSNSNELHWNTIFRQYPLTECFEQVFASHELHLAKPEPEIFRQVEDVIPLCAGRTIYVDDISQNRRAAEDTVGWRTCASIEELKIILASQNKNDKKQN